MFTDCVEYHTDFTPADELECTSRAMYYYDIGLDRPYVTTFKLRFTLAAYSVSYCSYTCPGHHGDI